MDKKKIINRITNLNVWRRGDERAPHKPLLFLYALGRCQRGENRLIPYADVDRNLKNMLVEFGPSRQSYHPEYPFWRLQTDGLWELTGAENLRPRNSDVPKNELLKNNVHGGLKEDVYQLFSSDRHLLAEIAARLLKAHFPPTYHDDILQAVGLDLEETTAVRPKVRDPYFRDRVLRAYEYQCAVCGFNVRVGDVMVALEAAHIKWHQAGGPDREDNGLALCTLHHKLFDRGAFTIAEDMRMKVSEIAHGTAGFNEWLLNFHGREIRSPQSPTYYPESIFMDWHAREVFKGNPRYY